MDLEEKVLGFKILYLFAMADGQLDEREKEFISKYFGFSTIDTERVINSAGTFPNDKSAIRKMADDYFREFGTKAEKYSKNELAEAAWKVITADGVITTKELDLYKSLCKKLDLEAVIK